MTADRRQDAVDHLSRLLERDVVSIEQYRPLVDRILATTTDLELAAVLSEVPVTDAGDVLLIECDGGVVKEQPNHLASTIELRCRSGVMKVDLTRAGLDDIGDDVDLEIENGKGVLMVIVPRGVPTRIETQRGAGGVFKSTLRPADEVAGRPRLIIHVQNDTGVIKLRHPRRWRFRRNG